QKVLSDFWKNDSTKEFLTSLKTELNYNRENSPYLETDLFISKRGRGGETFLHPYLFIEFAAWLSSDFRVKLYKWIYDNLIEFRNEAGT
ncbi:KilA-N domain-containing protein, partial [Collinsella tanakaei]|uniref:KilA-N domain-containing protein n=1 Tax=Collinsella tanakaei TaxID=626935 RepID=UPI001956D837